MLVIPAVVPEFRRLCGRMDIRIAAYGVIIRDGLILLSHWNEHGRSGWTLPGGGVDGAEHPVQAARREILEETGYEASIDRLLGIDTMVVPAARRHTGQVPLYAMRIVYRASVVSGELRNEVGGARGGGIRFSSVRDGSRLVSGRHELRRFVDL